MLAFLVRRPIAVLMVVLAALVLGVVALLRLPVSLLPAVAIPRITVQLSYAGATARTIENILVAPLRNELLQVNQLVDIRSTSRDEVGWLELDFPFGTNSNLAFIEVNEKIDQAMSRLPRDLERPRVIQSDLADLPVFNLAVTYREPATDAQEETDQLALSELVRNVLRRRLEQLPEVAFVDISGQRSPTVRVRPRPLAMQALGLTEEDLTRILSENNLDLGALLLQDGSYQYSVRFRTLLTSAESVRATYFRHAGRVLQLGDIAEVREEAQPVRGLFLHNGQPGLVMSIRKRNTASLFALERSTETLLTDLRQTYPQLAFDLTQDQTTLLRVSIDNLLSSLALGAVFAVLILFVFFREWQAPLLIGLAIPAALVILFVGFYALDLSLNVISLAGLLLGIGLMIDNAIIVIESIRQYRRDGLSPTEASVQGGESVIRPLISSALTTCAVFIPLIFLSGLAGALFYDQAVAVSLALLVSLLLSYLVLPTLVRLVDRREIRASTAVSKWQRNFERSVDGWLRRPWLVVVLLLLWVAVGVWAAADLPRRGFPALTRYDYQLRVDWNEPVNVAENRQRTRWLLDQLPACQSDAYVGEQQYALTTEQPATNELALLLYFAPDQLPASPWQAELESTLRERYPTARAQLTPLPNLFDQVFLNNDPDWEIRLQDIRNRTTPAWPLVSPLVDSLQAHQLYPVLPARRELVLVQPDYEQLLYNQVSMPTLEGRLRTLFNDNRIGELRTNDRMIPIVMSARDSNQWQAIQSASVSNTLGEAIPLRQLVSINRQQDYKLLQAGRSGEYLSLTFPTLAAIPSGRGLRDWLQSSPLQAETSGRLLSDAGRLRELQLVLGVSLVLLYLILAAQFESLIQPLIVLLVVPVSLLGSMILLWLSGASLNLISLIGMVVTGGIVVNDAILKVDRINQALRAGASFRAAVHEAGRLRLRAILMTSLTTILALLPVLWSGGLGAELQRPLAIAVIGGLGIGTLASLYLIPVFYRLLSRKTPTIG